MLGKQEVRSKVKIYERVTSLLGTGNTSAKGLHYCLETNGAEPICPNDYYKALDNREVICHTV